MASRSTRRTSAEKHSNYSPNIQDISVLTNLECLILAQSVYEYGANAWSTVAKTVSKHPLLNRPKQFFSAQSCHTIYTRLMNEAELECSDANNAPHAPMNVRLAQRHYSARLLELRDLIAAEEAKFKRIVGEIDDIRAGRWDDKIKATLTGTEDKPADPVQLEQVQEVTDGSSPSEVIIPDEPVESELSGITDTDETALPSVSSPPAAVGSQGNSPPDQSTESELLVVEESGGQDTVDDLPDLALPSSDPVPQLPEQTEVEEDVTIHEAISADGSAAPASEGPIEENSENHEIAEPQDTANMDVDEEPITEELLPIHREGKRKVSDVEDTSSESPREAKRPREESEPGDEDEQVASIVKRRPSTVASEQPPAPIPNKRFQTVITMLHAQISQHRNGNIFHNPIKNSEAPDYHDIIKRPMDLKTIKARIKDGVIASSDDFQREIYLMFANAMMYNRPGSDIYHMAEEMMLEAEGHINAFRQTEGLMRTRS
ncbi:hypothetical protein BJ138DRAFT_1089454 [Hygrophoropsis aurantiaca]|uniref:Uncharacterized protein n=1 Tax=Hygrophoropsis aurantiaca TaxID=72124 RepID=A0ACB8A8B0_9AGAM|nr:hypothetical protein BJ138DRAFT_1089454 [Hygrophoropsis aurantiaca]